MHAIHRFAIFAFLGLGGCDTSSRLPGTYTATATGWYAVRPGSNVDFAIPNDTFVVRVTDRHYQGYGYEVKVHGCTFRGDGDVRAASFRWQSNDPCRFDLPTLGPVEMRVQGSLWEASSGHVHLMFSTTSADQGSPFHVFALEYDGTRP